MMDWVIVALIAVAVAVLVVVGLRYVVDRLARAAQEYRDAIAREEIESVRAWLERQRQQPHG